jgi:uncharacterized protein (TIRG00374 family)
MVKKLLKNKKLRGILQIGLSLSLLIFLISRVGLNEIIRVFTEINPLWYLLAFLLFQANIIIRAYRWTILLHALNTRPPFRHMVYLYYLGFFANNFIPTGFGGDVVKVLNIRQKYGRGANALSSVVMDRLTGLLGTSLIALAALIWNGLSKTDTNLPGALWSLITFISLSIPTAFLLIRWTNPIAFLEKHIPSVQKLPLYDKIKELVETVNQYPLPVLLKALAISLPFTLNLILIQYAIARALGVNLPISIFSLFAPLIAIVNLLPISFNGLGTREAVYLLLYTPIGVPVANAIAMSLAYYFLRFGSGLIGGLAYLLKTLLRLVQSPQPEQL